eukprot:5514298-Lingulodinium_polyedra.AAC.1
MSSGMAVPLDGFPGTAVWVHVRPGSCGVGAATAPALLDGPADAADGGPTAEAVTVAAVAPVARQTRSTAEA